MSPVRSWFRHVLEAPLAAEAQRAVQVLLERQCREGVPPNEEARREVVEGARREVAALLHAEPGEILLTSGGTEAANLAIKGVAGASRSPSARLVASAAEHTAVLYPVRSLARGRFEACLLPVDRQGRVDPGDLEQAVASGAALVSIQHANHEVGSLQPIEEIAAVARAHNVPLHVDAVAVAGLAALDPERLGVDLLSLSASRLGGLSGAGALWVRPGVRLAPQIEGGTQEGGLRGGAENLLGLAALGAAAAAVAGREPERWERTRRLRDRLEDGLVARVGRMAVNGPPREARLPGHLHVSFDGAEGEATVQRLRLKGLEASTGSACTGGAGKPSHVLEAMGLEPARSRCSVLFSLGAGSREEEVDHALEVVPDVVGELRRIASG
jgi:cysteine desulfurase